MVIIVINRSTKIFSVIIILLIAAMSSGCIGDAAPVEVNNSSVTYVTSNSPMDGNFWMYMYLMHSFDSHHVTYVESNHYYSTHPSSTTTPKVTDVKSPAKKESFLSKASSTIKSETEKVGSSFKASKSGFKSSGSSYRSSSGFKSSRSGSFRSSGFHR